MFLHNIKSTSISSHFPTLLHQHVLVPLQYSRHGLWETECESVRGRMECVTVHTHTHHNHLTLSLQSVTSLYNPPSFLSAPQQMGSSAPALFLFQHVSFSVSLAGEQSFETCTGPAIYIPSHRLEGSLLIVSIVLPWKWVKKDSSSGQKGRMADRDGGSDGET